MRESVLVTIALAAAVLTPCARAEDAPKRAWTNSAELGLVMTTGNAQSNNLAVGDKFGYRWATAELTVEAAAVRVETTTRLFTNTDGALTVAEVDTTTTESFTLGGKYRHDISDRLFWYARAGWHRNRPTGIDARSAGGGGIGYRFLKDDRQVLQGEIGAEYTNEQLVDVQPDGSDSRSFASARAFLGYERKLGAASKLTGELEVFENLEDSDDLRARALVAVSASITDRVALKAGYTVLYDKQPATVAIPENNDTNGVPDPVAFFELDEIDTVFTASLVINF